MRAELERFVRQARERGLDLVSIRTLLQSAGWKDKQILAAFRSSEPDLPIPEPQAAGTARDAVLHLLAFTALYAWVISLVLLVFAYVDIALPDPAWHEASDVRASRLSAIRAQLATIVVAFPAFLFLWRLLLRELAQQPERAKGALRRWLIWLSLFVGMVTMASNAITLVYYLFEGALSLRFLLKVLTLFAVTGSGLCYLKLTMGEPSRPGR